MSDSTPSSAADTAAHDLRYKRSRFTARLPLDRLYSPSHYWLRRSADGVWQVGFTRFAKRMLGDVVEFDLEVRPGDGVALGQVIGWVEAFKAVADLYCVVEGRFEAANQSLSDQPDLLDKDPHGQGWLYSVRGRPDPACVDAHGYAAILDAQIDKMLGEEQAQ